MRRRRQCKETSAPQQVGEWLLGCRTVKHRTLYFAIDDHSRDVVANFGDAKIRVGKPGQCIRKQYVAACFKKFWLCEKRDIVGDPEYHIDIALRLERTNPNMCKTPCDRLRVEEWPTNQPVASWPNEATVKFPSKTTVAETVETKV